MKWLLRTALWFAFGHALIVACSDAAILEPRGEGDDGSGGSDPGVTPSTGGRASGGAKTSPPVPGTGARIGAGGSPIPGTGGLPSANADAAPPICPPPTVMSVEDFCAQSLESCRVSTTDLCRTDNQLPFKESVEQGCGYLRFTIYEGSSGTRFGLVLDQITGRLVHSWTAPVPCYSVVNIGTMPACSAWSFIPCDSLISRDAGVLDASTD